MEIKSEVKLTPDTDRMNYFHICECGREFNGFIKQTTCWDCISGYIGQILSKKEYKLKEIKNGKKSNDKESNDKESNEKESNEKEKITYY